MATARYVRDPWRPDFEELSGSFRIFSILKADFPSFADWPTLADYDRLAAGRGVRTASGFPVSFVPQPPKPRGRRRKQAPGLAYEQRVIQGAIPTREGHWHDFFNMLAWCLFPLAKAALNARQLAGGVVTGGVRTDEQNRLAMFDEGGVVLVEGPAAERNVTLVFGHALHEAVMRGQALSGGWTTVVGVDELTDHLADDLESLLAVVDRRLADSISANSLIRRRTPDGVRPF